MSSMCYCFYLQHSKFFDVLFLYLKHSKSLMCYFLYLQHSKFFDVEPPEMLDEFFEFVEEVPAYDEVTHTSYLVFIIMLL